MSIAQASMFGVNDSESGTSLNRCGARVAKTGCNEAEVGPLKTRHHWPFSDVGKLYE